MLKEPLKKIRENAPEMPKTMWDLDLITRYGQLCSLPHPRNLLAKKEVREIRKTLKADEDINLENFEPYVRNLVKATLRSREESIRLNYPGVQEPSPQGKKCLEDDRLPDNRTLANIAGTEFYEGEQVQQGKQVQQGIVRMKPIEAKKLENEPISSQVATGTQLNSQSGPPKSERGFCCEIPANLRIFQPILCQKPFKKLKMCLLYRVFLYKRLLGLNDVLKKSISAPDFRP